MGEGRVVGFPRPLTPLVGRIAEVAAAATLLGEARLVTLVGAGGAGKTRLAVEIAGGRPDPVFVDLAPLRDPGQVLPAVARVLGLREAGPQPLAETLQQYLSERRSLLVLDNFEHVLDAADDVSGLLTACPGLQVVVTSRAPLQVPGEHLLPVTPLALPDARNLPDPAVLADVASLAMFLERARASCPGFTLDAENARTVAEICLALDGLPLALELAAAQVRVFGLAGVLERSRDRFSVLQVPRRGVPERHRTLAGAVQWSVALLDDQVAAVFRRMSVFAGGCTVEAAQYVCAEPGQAVAAALATLVEHSLVIAEDTSTGMRYRMLETLREYAALLLDRGAETMDSRRRLLTWVGALADRLRFESPGFDEITSNGQVETEFDNVRAALETCAPEDTGAALRVAADLYHFWDCRGYLGEGRRHLQRLLGRPEARTDPVAQAAAWDALGLLLLWQDDHDAARTALGRSAALSESLGDEDRWAWSTANLMMSRFMLGDVEGAGPVAERAVAVALRSGSWGSLARARCGLGLVRWSEGRRAESIALLEECARMMSGFSWGQGKFSYFLGWFAFLDGALDRSAALLTASVAAFERIAERRSLPDALDALGCVLVAQGRPADAARRFAAAAEMRAATGARRQTYLQAHWERAQERVRAAVVTGSRGITARKSEVARLVADGLTNRQIGRLLKISERTAERHVENLRAKLGVGTRAQVAAWIATVPTPPG